MPTDDILHQSISKYLDCPARHVVIGYSGGVDSHLLLHAICVLKQQFKQHRYLAVHVNHGLSANAAIWQTHCESVCQSLNIDFIAISVDVDINLGQGVEAAARDARYAALSSVTEDKGLMFLGQHSDDQLETFMLQLKRGAGPKGLSGMAESRIDSNGVCMARPLLRVSRQQIEEIATEIGLDWITDESNQDTRFDRNFLRHQILPGIKQRWPGIAQAVSRSAALCAEQQSLLDEVTHGYLERVIDSDNSINIPALLKYSVAWQNQIVRSWLASQPVPMPSEAILKQLSLLLNAKQDSSPIVHFSGFQFRRFKDGLYCIENYTIPVINTHYPVKLGVNRLPCGLGSVEVTFFDEDQTVYFKTVAFSTRFTPRGERQSKPLKQWFKVWEYPVWKREQALMLYQGENALGLLIDGVFIACDDAPDAIDEHVKILPKIPLQ